MIKEKRCIEMSDKITLKAGIIGAGLMGRWHAHALKRSGGHLKVVVDTDLNAARRLAADYGHAEHFSDIERMLAQCDLDVLHICTPLSTHKRIAELSINAGLNLIIEKPLTPTAADTEHLLDMATDRGVLLCPVHQYVCGNGTQNALKWLPRIGRIIHMKGIICSAGGTVQPLQQLDMIVKDVLPHPLSLMQMFLPNGLSEINWNVSRPGEGELRATGETSGISLSIFISMNARPTENSFLIAGTEGTIHINLFHGFAFLESGKVSRTRKIAHPFNKGGMNLLTAAVNLGQRIIRREPAYHGLRQLISSFYWAVQNNESSPISREDTLEVARTRDLLAQRAGLVTQDTT